VGKLIVTDSHSRLGDNLFEELQIMKHAWKDDIVDLAAWQSQEIEDVQDTSLYETLLQEDLAAAEWGEEFRLDY